MEVARLEAIRGKRLTVDKRANIPESLMTSVQLLSGHKVTLIMEGEDIKIVAVEEWDETKGSGHEFVRQGNEHEVWCSAEMDTR